MVRAWLPIGLFVIVLLAAAPEQSHPDSASYTASGTNWAYHPFAQTATVLPGNVGGAVVTFPDLHSTAWAWGEDAFWGTNVALTICTGNVASTAGYPIPDSCAGPMCGAAVLHAMPYAYGEVTVFVYAFMMDTDADLFCGATSGTIHVATS